MIKSTEVDIRDEIFEIQRQIRVAQNGFDNVIEPQLISSYIYELKALNERFSYLIERAKAENQRIN